MIEARSPGPASSVRDRPMLQAAILALVVALGAVAVNVYTYANNYNGPPIRSDGFGYHVYLPAAFIYRDPFLRFLDRPEQTAGLDQYPTDDLSWAGLTDIGDGYLDKYAIGTAVLQTPFFLGALALAGPDASGFEPIFQLANQVSAIAYLVVGVLLLLATLRHETSSTAALLLVTGTVFATNLLHYGSYDASFSHVYTFALVSAGLYVLFAGKDLTGTVRCFLFGLIVGLAVCVRPTNALIGLLVLPWILEDRRLFAVVRSTAALAAGGLMGVAPQLSYWAATRGEIVSYSYDGEGFDFLAPRLAEYLFSVDKGAFFWHPFVLLLLIVTVAGIKRGRPHSLLIVCVVAAAYYVGASWHSWQFGGSFGARQALDVLPLLAVGAALGLGRTWSPRWGSYAGLAFLVVVNMVQMRGYITHEIPYSGSTWESWLEFWRSGVFRPG